MDFDLKNYVYQPTSLNVLVYQGTMAHQVIKQHLASAQIEAEEPLARWIESINHPQVPVYMVQMYAHPSSDLNKFSIGRDGCYLKRISEKAQAEFIWHVRTLRTQMGGNGGFFEVWASNPRSAHFAATLLQGHLINTAPALMKKLARERYQQACVSPVPQSQEAQGGALGSPSGLVTPPDSPDSSQYLAKLMRSPPRLERRGWEQDNSRMSPKQLQCSPSLKPVNPVARRLAYTAEEQAQAFPSLPTVDKPVVRNLTHKSFPTAPRVQKGDE